MLNRFSLMCFDFRLGGLSSNIVRVPAPCSTSISQNIARYSAACKTGFSPLSDIA